MGTVVTRARYCGWDAVRMRAGALSLWVVPQVGGRVMNVAFDGQELLFVHPELAGRVADVPTPGFPLWGGEKTWLAPQEAWAEEVPFFDLDSGRYALVEDQGSVTMTSRECRQTGVQITRRVSLCGEGWDLLHTLTNRGCAPAAWGPWGVTMVRRPGRVYLPTSVESAFPEGVKAFEDTPFRATALSRMGSVAVVDCTESGPFKFGSDADEAWMLGVVAVERGLVGMVKQVQAVQGARCGHGCVSEVFDSDVWPYFEMEVHGPVAALAPGASTTLQERTRVVRLDGWPSSEAEVRAVVDSALA